MGPLDQIQGLIAEEDSQNLTSRNMTRDHESPNADVIAHEDNFTGDGGRLMTMPISDNTAIQPIEVKQPSVFNHLYSNTMA